MAANRSKPRSNAKDPGYDNETPVRVRPKFEGPSVKKDGSLTDDSVRSEELEAAQRAEDASPVAPTRQGDSSESDSGNKKSEKKD